MLEGLRLRGDLAAGAWPAAGGEDGGGEMEFFEPFEAEEKGAEAVAVAQPASAAPAASAASASASAPAAATVVERTPPAAATVVERTPPAATTVKERTPPAAATVVERTPPAAATVKERTPPAAATVVERTPVVERNSPTASAKSDSQPFQPGAARVNIFASSPANGRISHRSIAAGPPSHPQQIGDAKKKAQHISEDEALFEKRYAELLR